MNCMDCGKPDLRWRSAWREVRGFDKARSQGGTNAVKLREPTGRVLCESCMVRRDHGLSPDQGSFL